MKENRKVVFYLKKDGFPALNSHQEGSEVVFLFEVHTYHRTNLQLGFRERIIVAY